MSTYRAGEAAFASPAHNGVASHFGCSLEYAVCWGMWPQRPRRQLQETLDGVLRIDNIIITMIRRPLKPDPKHRALKQSGTANPRPQSVRDPAFLEGDFFDPHDLTQVKYEMLRRVRSEGQSVTKASATFGVSRPTFYKVQADFDRNGLVGLLPAKRGPRQPHKITPEVARFHRGGGRQRRRCRRRATH